MASAEKCDQAFAYLMQPEQRSVRREDKNSIAVLLALEIAMLLWIVYFTVMSKINRLTRFTQVVTLCIVMASLISIFELSLWFKA